MDSESFCKSNERFEDKAITGQNTQLMFELGFHFYKLSGFYGDETGGILVATDTDS